MFLSIAQKHNRIFQSIIGTSLQVHTVKLVDKNSLAIKQADHNGQCEKSCEIRGIGQEMAVMV